MAPKRKDREPDEMKEIEVKQDFETKNEVPCKSEPFDTFKDAKEIPLFQRLFPKLKRHSQVYKNVGERQAAKPSYLKRNLPYMQNSRPPIRKHFKLNDMLNKKNKSNGPPYLTLTFLGYYDCDMPSGTLSTVRVETLIEKTYIDSRSNLKRKRIHSQPVSAQLGTNEIAINPDDNDKRPVPILSISSETISSSSNAVKLRYLKLRVVPNSSSSELYEVRHALQEEKGELRMGQGLYESNVEGNSNVNGVWITVTKDMNETLYRNCINPTKYLRFTVNWTPDCKSGWVPRPKKTNGTLEASETEVEKVPQQPLSSVHSTQCTEYIVSYEFIFPEGRMDTPADENFKCPFCNINYYRLYPLFKHIKNHDRFNCVFNREGKTIKVQVTPNEQADTSYEGNPIILTGALRGVVMRRTPFTQELVSRPKRQRRRAVFSLSEFFELDEYADQQFRPQTYGYNRQYFHSSTFMPQIPAELDYDSEGERAPDWLQSKTKMMIDDFTDVNDGEKAIFKMWNHHVLKGGFVADCHMPLAVQKFLQDSGEEIIKLNLVLNFQLHLTNLFEFGLLSPPQYKEAMRLLLEKLRATPNSRKKLATLWHDSRESWLASGGVGGPRDKGSAPSTSYDASSCRKQNQSSTFISGDGTLKRKMTGGGAPRAKRGRPSGSGSSKVVEDADEDSDDEKLSTVRRSSVTSGPPMKKSVSIPTAAAGSSAATSVADRALRKRKLSLEDRTSNGADPAKRVRTGSDASRRKSLTAGTKSPLRKSVAP